MDGIIYYSSLLACGVFGSCYKKFDNVEIKRSYGSGLGILVACFVCGLYVVYGLLLVWGNVIILKCCEKRYVHKVSLLFTWTLLFYIHSNIECSKYMKWIMQTMSLRLVGLAFEINAPHKNKVNVNTSKSTLRINDEDTEEIKVNAAEVISYAFFYIGLHKGPYYRWKTFNDHFNTPFSGLGDCRLVTEHKIRKVVLYTLGYWLLSVRYSADVYSQNNFYRNYGMDYRLMYNFPILIKYFFEQQIIFLLCTAVCMETGFGVYPAKCHPVPGHGPTKQFSLLKLAAGDTEIALKQDYNFGMLKCFDNQKLLMGPKMKDTMRGWDLPTRYWFLSNIYKDLVKSNKEVRSACSFLAWTIFRGPSKQQVILLLTLWVYVHLESDYTTLYHHTQSKMKRAWDIGFSVMRVFCLIYLAPCLVITDSATAMRYYNSIFWVFHIVLLILTFASLVLYKKTFLANAGTMLGKMSNQDLAKMKKVLESPATENHTGTINTQSASYQSKKDIPGNRTPESVSPSITEASHKNKQLPDEPPSTSKRTEKK